MKKHKRENMGSGGLNVTLITIKCHLNQIEKLFGANMVGEATEKLQRLISIMPKEGDS